MSKPKLQRIQRVCTRCGGEEFLPGAKCHWCNSRELRKPLPGEEVVKTKVFIALGPSWGLGINADQAGQYLLKNWPPLLPMKGAKVQLWEAPRGSFVSAKGIVCPEGTQATLILEKVL